MQCAEAVEHLPELLNRTLEPERAAQLQAHLGACSTCRAEWEETRLGAAVFDSHLPSEAIVALAWDRAPASVEPALAREHVASCAECADDLAAARESRLRETQTAPSEIRRRAAWVLPAALAAGLAAAAFFVGVTWEASRKQPSVLVAQSGPGQSANEMALEMLRQSEAKLRGRLDLLRSPQLNLPMLELSPESTRSRGTEATLPEIAVDTGDAFVALVLTTPAQTRPVGVELRNQAGAVIWRGAGLRPSPQGWYALGIPAELLTDGRFSVVLKHGGEGSPLATFLFRARRVAGTSRAP